MVSRTEIAGVPVERGLSDKSREGPGPDSAQAAVQQPQFPIPFPSPTTAAPSVGLLPSYSEAVTSPRLPSSIDLQVVEERSRIARELHDGVGQSLAYIKLKTHLLRKTLGEDGAWLEEELEALEALLGDAIAELRRCVYGLRPVYLESGGLLSALIRLVDEFNRLKQHRIQLDWVGSSSLPQTVEDAFFRTAQEALNNATEYAQAKRVTVRVEHLTARIRLIIQDDGVGCSEQAMTSHRGFGLVQMRERIEALGGTMTIESSPNGTRLTAVVPKLRGAQ